jgi:hypothetical protein
MKGSSAAGKFFDMVSWSARHAIVTGVAKVSRGKPEIILNGPSHIKSPSTR